MYLLMSFGSQTCSLVVAVCNCQETVASRISIFGGENTFSHILRYTLCL